MKTLYILFLTKALFCTYVHGYGGGDRVKPSQNVQLETTKVKECSQINDLLEKIVGDNGVLQSLTRAIISNNKSGSQMTKNDILGIDIGVDLIQGLLGINLGVDLDSKLVSGILDVNGLLQSLLGNNGTVDMLLQGLLQNRDDTQLSNRKDSAKKRSNTNILVKLLRTLGLSNLVSIKNQGSLLDNTVDSLLGNNLVADGLLKGLLTGDLLEAILGDESLLGCLLNRLLGGLLGDSSLLSKLLEAISLNEGGQQSKFGSKNEKATNQSNNKKMNTVEKILLLEMLNKMKSQKSQGDTTQKQTSDNGDSNNNYLNNYHTNKNINNAGDGQGTFSNSGGGKEKSTYYNEAQPSQNSQLQTTKYRNCSQINDLLENIVGDNGVLQSLTRAIMTNDKSGSQMTKNDILGIDIGVDLIQGLLGINLGVDLDSKLVNGILDVNGLLQSLLGNNGAVDMLLQGLLQNRDDTQQSYQKDSSIKRSNTNILADLLRRLGISNLLLGLPLFGNTVDTLLGKNNIADGLLKGLLTGDLLEAILGDESLLGCLLNRLLGGLLGDSSMLSKLLGASSYQTGSGYQTENQNNNRKLNAVEKVMLLEMLCKIKSQKPQGDTTQKQISGENDNVNNYLNNYSEGATNGNGNNAVNGRGGFAYNGDTSNGTRDCTNVNVLLEKIFGLLENLLRVTIIDDKSNGQVTKNDILGLKIGLNIIGDLLGVGVGVNLNSYLIDDLLGVDGLLQSLLGGNGAVDLLLKSLLRNQNYQNDQGAPSSSTENILLGLLTRLGLLNAQSVRNQGLVGNLVDSLLGNNLIEDGLLKGLLNGNLLEGILGDSSLLGCLLDRLLGGLLGENGLLRGLLGGSTSGQQGYQGIQNNNDQKMGTVEKMLLLQILQKILAEKQYGSSTQGVYYTTENYNGANYNGDYNKYINNGGGGKVIYNGQPPMQHQGEMTSYRSEDGPLSNMEKLFLLSLIKRLLNQNLECNSVQVPRYITINPNDDSVTKYITEISNDINNKQEKICCGK